MKIAARTSYSPKNASEDSELLFELTTSTLLSLRGNGDRVDPHDMLFIITRTCEFAVLSPTCSVVKITASASHSIKMLLRAAV